MKRAVIIAIAFLPAALLAAPAIVGVVDAVAWVVLGDTLIQADWWGTNRVAVAWLLGVLAIPVGGLTGAMLGEFLRDKS